MDWIDPWTAFLEEILLEPTGQDSSCKVGRGRESSSFHGSEFYCRHLTCHTSSQEIDYYQLQHRASLKLQTQSYRIFWDLELQWNPEGFRMSLGCFLKSSRLKHIPWAFQRLCWIRSPERCWMWHWQTQTAAMHSNNCHSMSNEACICIRITRENTKEMRFLGCAY